MNKRIWISGCITSICALICYCDDLIPMWLYYGVSLPLNFILGWTFRKTFTR